jgi:hypothetical protein
MPRRGPYYGRRTTFGVLTHTMRMFYELLTKQFSKDPHTELEKAEERLRSQEKPPDTVR